MRAVRRITQFVFLHDDPVTRNYSFRPHVFYSSSAFESRRKWFVQELVVLVSLQSILCSLVAITTVLGNRNRGKKSKLKRKFKVFMRRTRLVAICGGSFMCARSKLDVILFLLICRTTPQNQIGISVHVATQIR